MSLHEFQVRRDERWEHAEPWRLSIFTEQIALLLAQSVYSHALKSLSEIPDPDRRQAIRRTAETAMEIVQEKVMR